MKRHVAAFLVVLGLVLAFQIWFLGLGPGGIKLGDPSLSTLYTEALAHGQSYLRDTPDPAHPLLDTSLYHGRHYMYFGIVPFVLFMVPGYLLTGAAPSPEAAILFFCVMGYCAYGGILLLAIRAWKPNTPVAISSLAFASMIVASGTWPLMGRPAIYELENSSAYGFFALSLLCLARYEWSEGSSFVWLSLANACVGLVMGCRPNYFPAVIIVFAWTLISLRTARTSAPKRPRPILLVIIPILLIGISLASWNFTRFGNILDFGLKHTVSEDPKRVRPLSAASNLPYHLHRYTLGLPRLERYFPFVEGQKEGPFAVGPGHEISNQVYGFLIVTPVLVFALASLLGKKADRAFQNLAYVFFAAFCANFFFLSTVTMSCYRYPADFLGPLAICSAFGIMVFSESAFRKSLLFIIPVYGVFAFSFVGEAATTFSTANNIELFAQRRPRDFARAAGIFNFGTYLLERLAGSKPRAISLTIELPSDRLGLNDPILVMGENGAQDFFYIYYAGRNLVRFGYEAEGLGGGLSNLTACDFSTKHTLKFCLGALLPPADDPMLRNTTPSELLTARNVVLIKLDDNTILDAVFRQHPPKGQQFFGRSPYNAAFGDRFHGNIYAIETQTMPPLVSDTRWNPNQYGPLAIELRLANLPSGVFEPVFSIGYSSNGAQLLLKHIGIDLVSLCWVSTNGERRESPQFRISLDAPLAFVVSCGSLYPPLDSTVWPSSLTTVQRLSAKKALTVSVNGHFVWRTLVVGSDMPPASLSLGQDSLNLIPNVMPTIAAISRSSRQPYNSIATEQ